MEKKEETCLALVKKQAFKTSLSLSATCTRKENNSFNTFQFFISSFADNIKDWTMLLDIKIDNHNQTECFYE